MDHPDAPTTHLLDSDRQHVVLRNILVKLSVKIHASLVPGASVYYFRRRSQLGLSRSVQQVDLQPAKNLQLLSTIHHQENSVALDYESAKQPLAIIAAYALA